MFVVTVKMKVYFNFGNCKPSLIKIKNTFMQNKKSPYLPTLESMM